ncbi:MAG: Dyp-type peroxidase [Rhodocyclaceae bacterium]|nr:Dyp-type peroxidase [Rhodocyclaceae bacterium]
MTTPQPGILAAPPLAARYLSFSLYSSAAAARALKALAAIADGDSVVVGIGESLVSALGREIAGLKPFPVFAHLGVDIPSAPHALWCWLRGKDRGELLHQSRRITHMLEQAFDPAGTVDAFFFSGGRDLTGFEDGTENPTGDEADRAAIFHGQGEGLDGSSFVAVQQWRHDMERFEAMDAETQDKVVGRHKAGNEEMDDAPPAAHVKRTAQESFAPEAFVLRRSMPWSDQHSAGLMFVAFGRSFDAFEAQLHRMVGLDDGVVDSLFRFTHPLDGAYFWCPPLAEGRLDLRALGL